MYIIPHLHLSLMGEPKTESKNCTVGSAVNNIKAGPEPKTESKEGIFDSKMNKNTNSEINNIPAVNNPESSISK